MNNTINTTIPPELLSIASEVLLRSLDQATTPLTARQIRERLTGPYKFPLAELESLLEEHVTAGRVYHYPGLGSAGKRRYWTRGSEQFIRESILRMLANRSLPLTDLLRRQRNSIKGLPGMNETALRRLIGQMVAEGALHEWPPLLGSRTARLGAMPPEPRLYLEDAVEKIARKLGVEPAALAPSLDEVRRNLSQSEEAEKTADGADLADGTDLDDKVVERMLQVKLAATPGAPLPLRELWHSLRAEGCNKSTFDRIVLDLAANYRVALLKHDFPGMLSAADRAELVVDPHGNHYVGIARR
jgi:hypothetical protein